MKVDALVAEIGSTTTVVSAFDALDTAKPLYLGQGVSATTADLGDVTIGLEKALENLKEILKVPELVYHHFFASSSAAGGLKMTVHGLVYDMTVKAAKEAALGAGANIKWVTAGILREHDLRKIEEIAPNLILIAGGVDFGERQTALENVEMILSIVGQTPVIYAGNCENHEVVRDYFENAGKGHLLHIVENVYPKVDVLNVEPTRLKIQEVFEQHIVSAKGMSKIRDVVDGKILPTPGAVMQATKNMHTVLGGVMTIDLGGATTDVHSVTKGSPEITKMSLAPEPFAKRTVEGDLGVFVNVDNLINRISIERLAMQFEKTIDEMTDILSHPIRLPQNQFEQQLISCFALEAIDIAIERHVGKYVTKFSGGGQRYAEGKDLTQIKAVIGTGGVLTRIEEGDKLLGRILYNPSGMKLLPSDSVRQLIDRDYIMAATGMLSFKYPKASVMLLKASLGVS
jgi:uncharacterized protein (TIGR01319 family)